MHPSVANRHTVNLATNKIWASSSLVRQITSPGLYILLLLSANYSFANAYQVASLANISLEELGNIQVTSVSKKAERLADTAAAIYVITGEAIKRAGARSVPEALRLAPNLQVAQINSSQYAISARGFNSAAANKLLVMIDNRVVYTPLFSGVFWDAQDVMLQDIDRIEVISGSAGTLWGANAVNGVINIITKISTATTGNLVHGVSGNMNRGLAMRHGAGFGDSGAYRIYAKVDKWQHSQRENGANEPDAWDRSQIGFRSDWSEGDGDFKLQGDSYRNSIDQFAPGQQANTGTNLLGRWQQKLNSGSQIRMQTYIDRSTRDTPGTYRQRLNTFDLDASYSLPENAVGSQIIWGGGYRISDDHVDNSAALAFLPADRKLHWANLFIQQERALWRNFRLTLGGRLERNDYTGVEFLPNAKLAWSSANDKLVWLKLARPVRAPSRIDTEAYAPGNPPYLVAGGPDFRSETAQTMELGWRAQAGNLSYSLALFHNEYDHLRSAEMQPNGANSLFVFGNSIEGKVDGLEVSANYQLAEFWSVNASATLLDEDFKGGDLTLSSPGNDPRSQWAFGSTWNIDATKYFDISLRHVGKLPVPAVPSYRSLNAHFGWSLTHYVELGITGRNLDDPQHQEFVSGAGAQLLNPIQIERELDIALTVKF
ncbi:MAG: TonB-dependent receptor [Pseudomonadota bacterium]